MRGIVLSNMGRGRTLEGTDGIHGDPGSPVLTHQMPAAQSAADRHAEPARDVVERKAGLASFGTELGGGLGDKRQRSQGEILHAERDTAGRAAVDLTCWKRDDRPMVANWERHGGTACQHGCSEGRREGRRGQQMRSQAGGVPKLLKRKA